MLLSLALTGLILIISYLVGSSPPEDSFLLRDVTVTGNVTRKEENKNGIVLYIRHATITGSSANFPNNNTNEYKAGIVCYVSSDCCLCGQKIKFQGDLNTFKEATNPGEFDLSKYYSSKGYKYSYSGEVYCVSSKYNPVSDFLYRTKQIGKNDLLKLFDEENASILNAMIFGDKKLLSEETINSFSENGISHILAVSGLHISLIAGVLFAFFGMDIFPKRTDAVMTTVFLLGYLLMIGIMPGALRAVIMALYAMAAKMLKRAYDAPTAMAFSCLVTAVITPGNISDSAFLLSYLAVMGICIFYPTFLDIGEVKKGALDSVLISFSATFMTLPVVLNTYYGFSVWGIFLNLLILPCISVLLPAGIMSLISYHFLTPLCPVFVYVSDAILFFIEKVTDIMGKVYINRINTGYRPFSRVLIFYLCLFGIIFSFYGIKRKIYLKKLYILNHLERFPEDKKAERQLDEIKKSMKKLRIAHSVSLFLLLAFILLPVKKEFKVTFLDVGQGDGICVECKNGNTYLVDGGSTSRENLLQYVYEPFFEYSGKRKVNGWFLTHPDEDHVSVFKENLERQTLLVDRLFVPRRLREEFSDIVSEAEREGIEVIYLEAGNTLSDGEVNFLIFSPDEKTAYGDENKASLVMKMSVGETDFYLMGDSGREAEEIIGDKYKEDKNRRVILKSAHHGSAIESNSEDFYEMLKPLCTVISCGKNNVYGHPHRETLEILEKYSGFTKRTDESGAIIFTIKKQYIKVEEFKRNIPAQKLKTG